MTSCGPAEDGKARARARELGVRPGVFVPGGNNSITDVGSVRVGQVTLHRGGNVRTGVTAVLPHGANLFQQKVAGGVFVGNGFGKLAGSVQLRELGEIETPIVLTNTLSVGRAVEATVAWSVEQPANAGIGSVNAIVGETNDQILNDIRGQHVTAADVRRAIGAAAPGPVDEGSVGAGTGTVCFGWKGGIGNSSRRCPSRYGGYTVGVLVQTNYGGLFTLDGVPVGRELGHNPYLGPGNTGPSPAAGNNFAPEPDDGSCMIVVGTDAPLRQRDLERVAARGVFGLARTGASYSHGSGDIAVAFATPSPRWSATGASHLAATPPAGNGADVELSGEQLSALFQGVLEATEEAVYNSLCMATTVTGNGSTVDALPLEQVADLFRRYRPGSR